MFLKFNVFFEGSIYVLNKLFLLFDNLSCSLFNMIQCFQVDYFETKMSFAPVPASTTTLVTLHFVHERGDMLQCQRDRLNRYFK